MSFLYLGGGIAAVLSVLLGIIKYQGSKIDKANRLAQSAKANADQYDAEIERIMAINQARKEAGKKSTATHLTEQAAIDSGDRSQFEKDVL